MNDFNPMQPVEMIIAATVHAGKCLDILMLLHDWGNTLKICIF